MELKILVDFDNIKITDRNRGLIYITEKIGAAIGYHMIKPYNRLHFRLYGGWYEQSNITKRAQILLSEIQREFPRPLTVFNLSTGTHHRSIANVELAVSLFVNPIHHLLSTFRRRGIPDGLFCLHPTHIECTDSHCPIIHVYDFINTGRCSSPDCSMTSDQIIHRNQQKLIDSMLISDMIYLSVVKEPTVCVVSTDDDLWPGIETAIAIGSCIIHVHTRKRVTPAFYCGHVLCNYYQHFI